MAGAAAFPFAAATVATVIVPMFPFSVATLDITDVGDICCATGSTILAATLSFTGAVPSFPAFAAEEIVLIIFGCPAGSSGVVLLAAGSATLLANVSSSGVDDFSTLTSALVGTTAFSWTVFGPIFAVGASPGACSCALSDCLGPSAVTFMLVPEVSRGRRKGSTEGPFVNAL